MPSKWRVCNDGQRRKQKRRGFLGFMTYLAFLWPEADREG
jgi:hypothetical protein